MQPPFSSGERPGGPSRQPGRQHPPHGVGEEYPGPPLTTSPASKPAPFAIRSSSSRKARFVVLCREKGSREETETLERITRRGTVSLSAGGPAGGGDSTVTPPPFPGAG